MSDLMVDVGVVSATGSVIRGLARMMGEPEWGGVPETGSVDLDAALAALDPVVSRQVLGAATEVFRIGQSAIDAVEHLRATDAGLAAQG